MIARSIDIIVAHLIVGYVAFEWFHMACYFGNTKAARYAWECEDWTEREPYLGCWYRYELF